MNFLTPLVIATLLLTSCTEHASAFVAPSSRRSVSNESLPYPHSARTRTAHRHATSTFDFQTNTNVSKKDPDGTGLTPMSGITTILSKFASSAQENRKMLRQKTFVILAGFTLAFNSGYINGCCLSGVLHIKRTGVSTAAITGAYTNAGLAIANANYAAFSANARMILSFMGGAALSGLINPRPIPNRITPRYGPTFLVGSALLICSSVLATIQPEKRTFLYVAAMANGLQNAVSSAFTANLIRSSHMSGISSDIGMIFGQMLGGNLQNLWRFVVLSGLASSFFLGGIVSYGAVTRFQSTALSFSALLFLFIAISEISFTAYQEHVSLFKAASGQWEWGNNDAKQPPTMRYLKQLFRRHNADGSGYVDEDEFRDILLGAGVTNITDIGLRAVFRSIRAGGNENGVSMEQLIGLVACDGEEECMMIYDDDDNDDESVLNFWLSH